MVTKAQHYGEIVTINVDPQNDFMPGGALAVKDGDLVVPALNRLNTWTRANGGRVAFTRDWHPDDTDHFTKWPPHCRQYRAGAAFHDDLVIDIEHGDSIASKGMGREADDYSGFVAQLDVGMLADLVTNLPPQERTVANAVKRMIEVNQPFLEKDRRFAILIGGLATDYCVKATALDALRMTDHYRDADGNRLVDVILATDAIRAVNIKPGDGDRALAALADAEAFTLTSDEIINSSVLVERRG